MFHSNNNFNRAQHENAHSKEPGPPRAARLSHWRSPGLCWSQEFSKNTRAEHKKSFCGIWFRKKGEKRREKFPSCHVYDPPIPRAWRRMKNSEWRSCLGHFFSLQCAIVEGRSIKATARLHAVDDDRGTLYSRLIEKVKRLASWAMIAAHHRPVKEEKETKSELSST